MNRACKKNEVRGTMLKNFISGTHKIHDSNKIVALVMCVKNSYAKINTVLCLEENMKFACGSGS